MHAVRGASGSCMGFAIRSPIPLNYLRSGYHGKPMTIEVSSATQSDLPVLQEWPSSRGEMAIRLKGSDRDFVVENELMGQFTIRTGGSFVTVPPADGVPSPLREAFLWSTPLAVAGSDERHVVIHAASVAVEANAVLLVGDTHSGKSTMSAAFHSQGHRLLSDDGARCDVEDGTVYPGPALLRMRNDIADVLEPTDLTLVHKTIEKTHFSIAARRRGDGEPVPVSCVVFLRWGPHNVEAVAGADAVSRLWPLTFRLPGQASVEAAFASLAALARDVPVFELSRPRELDEIPAVVDRLIQSCVG